jgi:four helix bundle protein
MRKVENLRVIDVAIDLAVLTYQATRGLPRDERFGVVSQMRRAAVSVGSNIAEGSGRSSERQLLNYLQMAGGSVSELEFQAKLSARLGFGDAAQVAEVAQLAIVERRMIGKFCSRISE